MVSDERVKQFQLLYKKRFGVELSKEEALEKSAKLIRLIQIIYKPMTQQEMKLVEKRRNEMKI